jgi:hypothetical protein
MKFEPYLHSVLSILLTKTKEDIVQIAAGKRVLLVG